MADGLDPRSQIQSGPSGQPNLYGVVWYISSIVVYDT